MKYYELIIGFLTLQNLSYLIGLMGLVKRIFPFVIAILLSNPFIGAHAGIAVYIFSWTMYDNDTSVSDSVYSDLYFDSIKSEGILTNHIVTSGGYQLQYSFFHGEIADVQFDLITVSPFFFYQYVDSAYLSQSGSIFLLGPSNNGIITGLTEIQLNQGENDRKIYSIPHPEFLTLNSNMIDIGSNDESNELLVIANYENDPQTLIYDYTESQWIEVDGDLPSHPSRFGDLAISDERNEAIYYNSLETIISGENATFIFDFETLSWSEHTGSFIPGPLISYDIFYHPGIMQYVLLGGVNLPSNTPNSDVWLFDPAKMEWKLIFEELPILKNVLSPKFYYDSIDDIVVGFGQSANNAREFKLFSINMERYLSGVEIDFGVPTPIILAATGITLAIGLVIVIAILLVKRRSLIEIS